MLNKISKWIDTQKKIEPNALRKNVLGRKWLQWSQWSVLLQSEIKKMITRTFNLAYHVIP